MKFSVCIDMMFSRHAFEDRIAAVRTAGLSAVEFWKWTNKDIDRVSAELVGNHMDFAIFNIDSAACS